MFVRVASQTIVHRIIFFANVLLKSFLPVAGKMSAKVQVDEPWVQWGIVISTERREPLPRIEFLVFLGQNAIIIANTTGVGHEINQF